MRKPWLVLGPVAGQKDEREELHAQAEEGDVLERFFEDNEDVAVHVGRIGYVPEVEPVGVNLSAFSLDTSFLADEPTW